MTLAPNIVCDIDPQTRAIDDVLNVFFDKDVEGLGYVDSSSLTNGLYRLVKPRLLAGTTRKCFETRLQQVMANRARLRELLKMPLVPQRSAEWYELRKSRITASDAAQAIGQGKFGTKAQLVQKKVLEGMGTMVPFVSAPPMIWGTMFEDMAARCYAQYTQIARIDEFGLIPHPTLPFFGASPDGITSLGTMVEIKCPWKRKINGVVPDQYRVQMQGQMAVCDISECDYIECEMVECRTNEEYIEAVGDARAYHGVIVETKPQEYVYSPPDVTASEAIDWASTYGTEIVAVHRWHLKYMHIQRIPYDDVVWQSVVPKLAATYDEICGHIQKGGMPVAEPKASAAPRTLKLNNTPKYRFVDDDDD